jgi:phenylalanyl-tRNA synthetase beta chain
VVIADERGRGGPGRGDGRRVQRGLGGTTEVLLEAATFDPRSIRRTASGWDCTRRPPTGSSAGSTPPGSPSRAARAAALLAEAGRGQRARRARRSLPAARRPRTVKLSRASCGACSGVRLQAGFAAEKLGRLGMTVTSRPTARRDGAHLPARPHHRGGPGRGGAADGRVRPPPQHQRC